MIAEASRPSAAAPARAWREKAHGSPASLVLGVGLALAAIGSMCLGAVRIPLEEAVATLTGADADPLVRATLLSVRLPRVLLAMAVGAVLAVSGLALQALFRNPLAEPSLMGTSAGAATGAVGAIVFGAFIPAFLPPAIAVFACAFIGGLGATALAQALGSSRASGQVDTSRLLLGGIAVNAVAWTCVGLLTYLADDAQLRSITFWNLGSFAGSSWSQTLPALLPMGLGVALLLRRLRLLNLLLLGEREVFLLGVRPDRLKRAIVVAVSLCVAGAVAAVGTVGFVGLVVPAMVRLVVGPDVRRVALPSLLLGALLTTVADLGARTLVMPAELPVGLLTSLVGAPVFVWLLRRGRPA